jgi:hypothetical protein
MGFSIILSLGYHDTPTWLHDSYPDSHYLNQFGEPYIGDSMDSGDANLVFNPQLRALVEYYFQQVFADLGTDFIAVRVGGGRYGELTYPPADYGGRTNNYWSFDANARRSMPTSGWVPGQSSPNGEATRFVNWYLDSLVDYQNWQISTLRRYFDGDLMVLYPSWGIRPGQLTAAIATNLDGSSPAERNGEVQRGFDFERQVKALTDPRAVVTTTWLDANAADLAYPGDVSLEPQRWSPVKYLASLANAHTPPLQVFGENTGWGDVRAMERTAAQMYDCNLIGMLWFREEQLFSGQYATLDDYQRVIDRYGP